MKISTIDGEIVTIRKNEIIWNALDYLRSSGSDDGDVYLALEPRRPGIRVRRDELAKLINLISPRYSK